MSWNVGQSLTRRTGRCPAAVTAAVTATAVAARVHGACRYGRTRRAMAEVVTVPSSLNSGSATLPAAGVAPSAT